MQQRTVRFGLQIDFPVAQNDQGVDVVPLKPITDMLGLDWGCQYKKASTGYLIKRFGTCLASLHWGGQRREMVCIRQDRIAAFLNTVNPESVLGQGNEVTADFLEKKQESWDDLIHVWESARRQLLSVQRKNEEPGEIPQSTIDFISQLLGEKKEGA